MDLFGLRTFFLCDIYRILAHAWRKTLHLYDLDHTKFSSQEITDNLESSEYLKLDKIDLWQALMSTFAGSFFLAGVFAVLKSLMAIGQAISLRTLLSKSFEVHESALALAICTVLYLVFSRLALRSSQWLGLRVRIAVVGLVFRNLLKLPLEAVGRANAGQVVNLLTTDSERLFSAVQLFHFLIVSPLALVVIMVSCYLTLGPSSLYGFCIPIFSIMLQYYLAKLIAKLKSEVFKRAQANCCRAVNMGLATNGYLMMLLVSIGCLCFTQTRIDAAVVFPMAAYYQLATQHVLENIRVASQSFFDSRVAAKRITAILTLSRMETPLSYCILHSNQTLFTPWTSTRNQLHVVDASNVTPDTVALLLNVLLKEAKVGFCSESPWVFPGTVRENILAGSPYCREKFWHIASICGLLTEIVRLPMSKIIGSKGATLSGGQKQIIALARAVYAEPNFFVFWECFNAVNTSLRDKIVKLCLNDYLSGKQKLVIMKQESAHSHDPGHTSHSHSHTHPAQVKSGGKTSGTTESKQGKVHRQTLLRFLKCTSPVLFIVILIVLCTAQATLACDLWLKFWSGNRENTKNAQFYYIYAALVGGAIIANMMCSMLIQMVLLLASNKMHKAMTHSVMHACMSFFCNTRHAKGPMYCEISAAFDGLWTIKSLQLQDYMKKKFHDLQDAQTRPYETYLTLVQWLVAVTEGVSGLYCIATIFVFTALSSSDDSSTTGLALFLAMSLINQTQMVIRQSAKLENLFIHAERIFQYCDTPSEHSEFCSGSPVTKGEIQFEDVTFSHSHGPSVVKKLNLHIKPKEKVALVGKSGCGKSTSISLLLGLHHHDHGNIKIDGESIENFSLKDLRNACAVVPQEHIIFPGSLRFNIDPSMTSKDADLWEAVQTVKIDKELSLDSEIKPDVSKELKCKISLARCLIKKSKILIFDEASASLDAKGQNELWDNMQHKLEHSTVIIVAHRSEWLAKCNRIIFL